MENSAKKFSGSGGQIPMFDAARQLLQMVPPGTEISLEVRFPAIKKNTQREKEILFDKKFQENKMKKLKEVKTRTGRSPGSNTSESEPNSIRTSSTKSCKKMNKRVYSAEIVEGENEQLETTDSIFPQAQFIPREDADSFRANSKLSIQPNKKLKKEEGKDKKKQNYHSLEDANNYETLL